jgi:proliferating cell nuclear antigen
VIATCSFPPHFVFLLRYSADESTVNSSLGMSIASLQKIVKCAANDDVVTLRADESQDVLGLLFENKSASPSTSPYFHLLTFEMGTDTDRVGEYEMKLMDIDQEHLGIPDTVYDAEVTLPAAEFARIIRDLKELGESVKIEVSKDGVRFSADGDIGSASVTLKPSAVAAEEDAESEDEDEAKVESEDEDEDDDVSNVHLFVEVES